MSLLKGLRALVPVSAAPRMPTRVEPTLDSPRALYARKGETVTCQRGHPIADVGRDLVIGAVPVPGDLCNWRQAEPAIGDDIPYCAECGATWARNKRPFGFVLHFHEGWRAAELSESTLQHLAAL